VILPWLQLLLVAALFLVVPRSGTKGFARLMTPDTFSKAAVKMDTIPEGQGAEAYCIVFDAGSTGLSSNHVDQRAIRMQGAFLPV
jgi:hypothetical protein